MKRCILFAILAASSLYAEGQDLNDSFDDCAPWSGTLYEVNSPWRVWNTSLCGGSTGRLPSGYYYQGQFQHVSSKLSRSYSFKAGQMYLITMHYYFSAGYDATLRLSCAHSYGEIVSIPFPQNNGTSEKKLIWIATHDCNSVVLKFDMAQMGGDATVFDLSIDESPSVGVLASISGPSTMCNSFDVITLSASAGQAYFWPHSYATTRSINIAAAGVYTVYVLDNNGFVQRAVWNVGPAPPTPTISPVGSPLNVCQGSSVTLTASSSPNYLWKMYDTNNYNGPHQTIGTGQSVAITPTLVNAMVSLEISYPGCTMKEWKEILKKQNPTVAITGQNQVCPGGTTTLSATPGSSYLWSNGQTTQSISAGAGTYTVTVTDLYGCSGTSSQFAVTSQSYSAYITGYPYICAGEPTTLTAGYGGPVSSYLWSNGATTPSITTSSLGAYSVTITSSIGCIKTSAPVTIAVAPNIPGSITINGDFCWQGSVELVAGEGTGYVWSGGQQSQSFVTYNEGPYTVGYKNNYGCQVSATAEVAGCPGCVQCPRIAFDEQPPDKPETFNYRFGVYPNPAKSKVMVVLTTQAVQDCPVNFYNFMGNLCKTVAIEKGMKGKFINISDLQPGVYVVEIADNNHIRTRKLIVQY